MGKNADHVRELREQAQRRIQIRDGGAGLQATPNGRAAKVTSVKDVRVDEKGNLIVTKRDDFIGEGGNVAGIGGAVEQNIGKVGTKEKAKKEKAVENVTVENDIEITVTSKDDSNVEATVTKSGSSINIELGVYWK